MSDVFLGGQFLKNTVSPSPALPCQDHWAANCPNEEKLGGARSKVGNSWMWIDEDQGEDVQDSTAAATQSHAPQPELIGSPVPADEKASATAKRQRRPGRPKKAATRSQAKRSKPQPPAAEAVDLADNAVDDPFAFVEPHGVRHSAAVPVDDLQQESAEASEDESQPRRLRRRRLLPGRGSESPVGKDELAPNPDRRTENPVHLLSKSSKSTTETAPASRQEDKQLTAVPAPTTRSRAFLPARPRIAAEHVCSGDLGKNSLAPRLGPIFIDLFVLFSIPFFLLYLLA